MIEVTLNCGTMLSWLERERPHVSSRETTSERDVSLPSTTTIAFYPV
jgi:hypothetical protein